MKRKSSLQKRRRLTRKKSRKHIAKRGGGPADPFHFYKKPEIGINMSSVMKTLGDTSRRLSDKISSLIPKKVKDLSNSISRSLTSNGRRRGFDSF